MTKDEWKRRCAARYVQRTGANQEVAEQLAEACFEGELEASEEPFDETADYRPEDCADAEMDNW